MASRRTPIFFVSTLALAALYGCSSMSKEYAEAPSSSRSSGANSSPVATVELDAVGGEGRDMSESEIVPRTGAVAPGRSEAQKQKKADSGQLSLIRGMVAGQPAPPAEPVDQDGRVVPEGGSTNHGVNGFDLAAEDHLSTFAIDVDTASYTMARKNLQNGYLPAEASVRVEEFVNYLPYEYKRPVDSDPFSVDFEASPSPWDEQYTLVRIGVQGKKVAYDQRKPVNLTFLVDVSGSMRSSDKLDLLKESLIMLTEELEDGDTVAIATYAGATKVVLPPTPISQAAKIKKSLSGLTAGGSTAMNSGIQLAYNLADETYRDGSVNRVIVCSDGDANVGQTDTNSMANGIKGYAKKGITLTTLGFGNGNFQDTRMEQLANQGDGNYFYIDSRREARRVLVDRMTSTMEVIAKDVKIQVDWNPEAVHAYRLVGYENRDVADRDFRNDEVDAGEIGSGLQVTALYEVALTGDSGDLATVRVRNKAPGPDSPAVERTWTLDSSDLRPAFSETSRQFQIAASAGYFAEILRGSPWVHEISLTQVAEMANHAKRVEYPEDAELVELIRTAARLKGEGMISRR